MKTTPIYLLDIFQYHTSIPKFHLLPPLSTNNTLPMGNSASSHRCGHRLYGKLNAHAHNTTCCHIRGHSNQNSENVSNSYSRTIHMEAGYETWRIQAWLSPLEPYRRHQDVSSSRLNGVGDWVLWKNEFKTWCKSQNCSVNPTLLCCGDQGVGKTYIRYECISQKP